MLSFNQYVRAQSLEEAYTLCQKKSNVVLGGMLWLKMQKKNAGTAIDLCDLGLDQIEESEEEYRIGAMVSLRTLENHAGLNALTQGAMAEAVKHIVGVQFRNLATAGGSIYGRFGFFGCYDFIYGVGCESGIVPCRCDGNPGICRIFTDKPGYSDVYYHSEDIQKNGVPLHEEYGDGFSGTYLCCIRSGWQI